MCVCVCVCVCVGSVLDTRVGKVLDPQGAVIYGWFLYQLMYSPVDKFVSRADLVGCSLLRTMSTGEYTSW